MDVEGGGISSKFDQSSSLMKQGLNSPCVPSSFAQSEPEVIIRRQRPRHPNGLKHVDIPSRFHGTGNEWEFAGWGNFSYLDPSPEEFSATKDEIENDKKSVTVGLLRGASLSGNSMTSSVFYAFPAVVSVAAIFSPLSLLIACLVLFLWKPIFLELRSAIFVNGANYTYLLQFGSRTMALLGASITLLDSLLTSTESAATAASYLQGEFGSRLVISEAVLTIVLLIVMALFCFLNVRRSSLVTFLIFGFHGFVMLTLMIASVVFWGRNGSAILISNWNVRPKGALLTARAIFNGICVGFLGVTGFETTPTYVEVIRRDVFPGVLSIALITTLLLNGPMMLCVYVVLPTETILQGTNILSILASSVAGEWLRVLVVIDAILVLSGSIIDGICSANALLERLAKDRVFSSWLLRTMPFTGSQYIAITICVVLDILLYACSAFNLVTLSSVFTITFLMTLMTFVISNLMLKFNCDELPRKPRMPFLAVILTLAVVIVLLIGNIALSPLDLALFVAYFGVIASILLLFKTKLFFMRLGLWISCQCNVQSFALFRELQRKLINAIKRTARHPVIVWVGHDDIHALTKSILYIRKNELTSHIIFAYASQHSDPVISEELASNIKILDEAFPSITLDFLMVRGDFGPMVVRTTSRTRAIPISRMFMFCPSPSHQWEISDYKGIRIIPRH